MRIPLSLALTLAMLPVAAAAQDREGDSYRGAAEEQASSRPGVEVEPYIEARQVVTAELSPGDAVLTYTQLAAGVDVGFGTRYSQGSVSLRYERTIGYGDAADYDTLSGIARTSLALAGPDLTFEAGGLAARTRVDGNGGTSLGGFGANPDSTSQLYSVYAGPSLATHAGPVELTGAYRLGYTRVESPDMVSVVPGADPIDFFDESVTHNATARAGVAPGTVLPVGVGVGAGWNRQDVSNLDQRVDDRYVRADVTVPVSPNVALVGGVGYEDVEVSSRDAVRDVNGVPVLGPDGRYLNDTSSPRQIAYQTDGLIWDVGVMWRPSRRTSAEAHYGRRYGSTTYYGSLTYAPSANASITFNAYDNITGFGGLLNNAIDALGTDFSAVRNPITGDLGGCVAGVGGDNCALARIGSLRGSVFRSRGVSANFAASSGRTSFGVGAGYDRRRFIGAPGTVLADVDGVVDESYWLAGFVSRQLDRRSQIAFSASGVMFDSGFANAGDTLGYSATLAYNRDLLAGLSATAAVGLDGISREDLEDFQTASALVGLRYSF